MMPDPRTGEGDCRRFPPEPDLRSLLESQECPLHHAGLLAVCPRCMDERIRAAVDAERSRCAAIARAPHEAGRCYPSLFEAIAAEIERGL